MIRLVVILVALGVGFAPVPSVSAPGQSPRPDARSSEKGSGARATPQERGAVRLSPRPEVRSSNLKRKANVQAAGFRKSPSPFKWMRSKRKVCGETTITGEAIAPIPARVKGCGLTNGVKVTAVQGVQLSTPVTIDCATARALNDWVANGVVPAVGQRGGGVVELKVAAHYICRTRNNRPGARISEHGRGRAIDISAFHLKNGTRIQVLTGWRDPNQGPILKKIHAKACGPFGTVLGPRADRHHRDHFHMDTARHANGNYCR